MKNTTLENPDITVKDERIIDLDRIVGEVKQSEEWEAVKMNILEIGIEKGWEEGRAEGREEGRAEGREEGRKEGEERFARLTQVLLSANKGESLNRAITDMEYREQLYREYGIY